MLEAETLLSHFLNRIEDDIYGDADRKAHQAMRRIAELFNVYI